MQEHVFMRITKSKKEQEDLGKTNWSNCTFEVIHFKETRTEAPSKLEEIIVNAFPSVFKETLPGLPPAKGIKHKITLKGSIPKARSLYWLTPAKDTALRAYLEEALKKGLIRPSNSSYGAAVFFEPKKMAPYDSSPIIKR